MLAWKTNFPDEKDMWFNPVKDYDKDYDIQ
jgi:hypothetical protein